MQSMSGCYKKHDTCQFLSSFNIEGQVKTILEPIKQKIKNKDILQ